ncbi:MAG: chloride channel protein [Acidibrevibacterium sp.]|jgi:CIC family chloride channel protein|uniref:chloride channel protein n=1 Tax=Acidibrevibacterium fodinaquatile TaxID=1969806 RepID=UPI0023A8CB5C|nr:chloride channel protein [Acidibrevibacterium fodinaquatile]MCA7118610.1 chloride channel protein [Acidibrevibacterium fodinaquatile]
MSVFPFPSGAAARRDRPLPLRPRRPLGEIVLHVPQTLRALVRADEIWLVVLAALVGCGAGLCVVVMNIATLEMHHALFLIYGHERLSGMAKLDRGRLLLVPSLGGLVLGLSGLAVARFWPRRAVDPIEANALYGGRMSLNDSLIVVLQTIFSNGVGASVGLEAGYSQIGAALGSRLGRSFRVRRNDLRLLVGCGAAGAIGAAFNAPLTGAFYAFELVIGTYSLMTLAPVAVASISAIAVDRWLLGDPGGFELILPSTIPPFDYIPVLALGMVCALFGVAIMRAVTLTEEVFRHSGVPAWARPAIGGLAVGIMALVTPQVLSSGHAALHLGINAPYSLPFLALLVALKAAASAISIGSGFRGGLFFASLFLGAMLGKLFAAILAALTVKTLLPGVVCAVVGMSGLATAIVGGPLTMGFLALESTGSLPLTIAVLAASVVSALTVRRTFGYSFATWRFHLRGEAIRSAVDVGWIRNLTVGRMMRREVRTVRIDTPLANFRRDFPLGSEQRVIIVDQSGRYAGIIPVAEAHAVDGASTLADILHHADQALLPQMSVKDAISAFEQAESDALAVIDSLENRRVIGLLTEQYALRRYSEELDRRRRDLSGE